MADTAAHAQWTLRFEHGRRRQWVWAQPVSASFFDLLGAEPALGRSFGPAPLGTRSAEPEVVFSDRFWSRAFDRDPGVLGRTVRLNAVDLSLYAGVAVLFAVVGALACYLPARQAVRVDPMATLRAE